MRSRRVLLVLAAVLAVAFLSNWADAQPYGYGGYGGYGGGGRYGGSGSASYRPASPTFSSWFGLYQKNGGPLDNYHTFVLPRQQLQSTLQQQAAGIQGNNAQINMLGQQVTQVEQEGNVSPTGTGSVFMDLSHFYPSAGGYGGLRGGSYSHSGGAGRGGSSGTFLGQNATYTPGRGDALYQRSNAGSMIGR